MSRETELVNVARQAKRFLEAVSRGQHVGPSDDLLIGRELARVLARYDDVEPVSDQDRCERAHVTSIAEHARRVEAEASRERVAEREMEYDQITHGRYGALKGQRS